MALLGRLDEFHLHHIIGLLQSEKSTGELILVEGAVQAVLYFQEGAIVHAVAARLAGVEAAVVPFGWIEGTFRFEVGTLDIEPTITATNAAIVASGRRRAEEAQEVRTQIASMHLVVRVVPQVPSAGGHVNLSFEEWRFLTLVDGRRDLETIRTILGRDAFDVRLLAHRLVKSGLIELLDPRLSMIRMVVLPIEQDLRPPQDPETALMDDLALDMLSKGRWAPRALARAQVLTADDVAAVLRVEGRPDLADRLLLSEVMMARLGLERNMLVHLRVLDEKDQ